MIWWFVPLALLLVVGIITGLTIWIKSEIRDNGLACTLFVIFVLLACILGLIGLIKLK